MAEINPVRSNKPGEVYADAQADEASNETSWSAPEYEYWPKSVSWFWLTIIAAILILAVAVWQKNFLFGFFVIVAEILLIVWGNREPREVHFSVSDRGLTIDNKKLYAWSEIQNWSADEPRESGRGDIILDFKARFRPNLRILVPKDRFAEVKAALAERLPEVEREESVIDSLEKFLGF